MAVAYSRDKNGIRIDHSTLTPRYSVTNNESLNAGITYLNEHGYAVISDIMDENEIKQSKRFTMEIY